jgi:hypothetical protein
MSTRNPQLKYFEQLLKRVYVISCFVLKINNQQFPSIPDYEEPLPFPDGEVLPFEKRGEQCSYIFVFGSEAGL